MPADLKLLGPMREEVLAFETERFRLAHDVAAMVQLRREEAHEGATFYASRIVEELARVALTARRPRSKGGLRRTIDQIKDLGMAAPIFVGCAHGVRRLGNDARHVSCLLNAADSDTAMVFTERWLHWFFCERTHEAPLASISEEHGLPQWLVSPDLYDAVIAVSLLERGAADADSLEEVEVHLIANPSLAGLAAEALLDRQEWRHAAERLLDNALEAAGERRFGPEQRLVQLRALAHKRAGVPERAIELLEKEWQELEADPEVWGIKAGAHKSVADRASGDSDEALRAAEDCYSRGFAEFPRSAYLGVNSAACKLWLGEPSASRGTARKVCSHLENQAARADGGGSLGENALDLWSHLSLAEARLLCGEIDLSGRTFAAALARLDDLTARDAVAREQLQRNLEALGLDLSIEKLLVRSPPSSGPPFRVGVTGHRRLPTPLTHLRAFVSDVLRDLRQRLPPERDLILVTALAEGADQLVAEVALSRAVGARVEVVLPLELEDYRRDFVDSEDAERRLLSLLPRASRFCVVDGSYEHCRLRRPFHQKSTAKSQLDKGSPRELAYLHAGLCMVDTDALVAIWDGKPERGVGGTGQIVRAAREAGTPLRWITPDGADPGSVGSESEAGPSGWELPDELASRLEAPARPAKYCRRVA
jgi:hypothetical protein